MANRFLEKKVAKWTFDVSSAYATYVTGGKGLFAAADIDEDDDTITIENHGFTTGDHVGVVAPAGGVTATAPAFNTAYYVIYVDKDTIQLATSAANAKAGTEAPLTAGSAAGVYLVPQVTGSVKSIENGENFTIPSGAVITSVWYEVVTTFQSNDGVIGSGNADDGTIGIGIQTVTGSSEDLVSAIAISDSSNVWDDGMHGTLAGSPALGSDATTLDSGTGVLFAKETAATYIQTTTDKHVQVNIANDVVLHAGKLHLYIEYVI